MDKIHVIRLDALPIVEQLAMEEALLRADGDNWCIVNTGAPPAIVMGISGKPHLLLDLERVRRENIPLIQRFSGGGTVYVDTHTIFVTFIFNNNFLNIPAQSKAIMQWSESLYSPLFEGFQLRENDYVFGEKKFGGNAQYIQKNRWLHHTSFLWDYDVEKMNCLLLPAKRPTYRSDRSHDNFLCRLNEHFPNKEDLMSKLLKHLEETFCIEYKFLEDMEEIVKRPHRKATVSLTI